MRFIMRNILTLISALIIMQGCNNQSAPATETITIKGPFLSERQNGKWTTDITTAQYLKTLHYTVENFTLLNKKKFENLPAYREFGELMSLQIKQIGENSGLDVVTKERLLQKLQEIESEAIALKEYDMPAARQSLGRINKHMAEIDSFFNYQN